jgi:hypothetical protein
MHCYAGILLWIFLCISTLGDGSFGLQLRCQISIFIIIGCNSSWVNMFIREVVDCVFLGVEALAGTLDGVYWWCDKVSCRNLVVHRITNYTRSAQQCGIVFLTSVVWFCPDVREGCWSSCVLTCCQILKYNNDYQLYFQLTEYYLKFPCVFILQ